MANIELVIKIAEEAYQGIVNANKAPGQWGNDLLGILCAGIANGTQLPKGHGRLFDERDIVDGSYEIIGNKIYELDPILEADISGKEIEKRSSNVYDVVSIIVQREK